MLRRAIDLGGFHQVIFICHAPLVWELADAILSVRGGCVVIGDRGAAVTVESPHPARHSTPLLSPNPENRVCHL